MWSYYGNVASPPWQSSEKGAALNDGREANKEPLDSAVSEYDPFLYSERLGALPIAQDKWNATDFIAGYLSLSIFLPLI